MDIYINGSKIDYKPMFPLTWDNMLRKLLQNYIKKDNGIVGISVDGIDSLHFMLEDSFQMVQETIGIIQIETKDSVAITKSGITKVITLIEGIKKEISESADLYREGRTSEASSKIVKIMEAFKPMVNFINSVGMSFGMNFDEIKFDPNTTLRTKMEAFVKSLNEMVAAQEKTDYVELADYLEYQMIEDMNDWSKVVDILLHEIDAVSPTTY